MSGAGHRQNLRKGAQAFPHALWFALLLIVAPLDAGAAVRLSFDSNNPAGSGTSYAVQRKSQGAAWAVTPEEPVAGTGTVISVTSRSSGTITATRTGYTVTATADFFQATDRNRTIRFGASGPEALIGTVRDARTVVVSVSGTNAATTITVSTERLALLDETVTTGTWVYRALARKGNETSAFSSEVTVTVPPSAPSIIDVTLEFASVINMSTRMVAGNGDDAAIIGMVTARHAGTYLIRGVGPSLSRFQIDPARLLQRPRLRLMQGQQEIAANSGWANDPLIAAAAKQVDAFALSADSFDAALLVRLDPGIYTAVLDPADGIPGIALVESYLVR